MSGRVIDRAVLTVLGSAALYLYFLNAGFGIPLSCLMAFAAASLARWLIRRRPRRYRWTAAQAGAAVDAIARMPDEEAAAALHALLDPAHPPSCHVLIPLPRHASAAVTQGDVFALWRAHRGEERLLIAATCPAAQAATDLAATLSAPSVAIADRKTLVRVIRRTGQFVPPEVPRTPIRHRLRRAAATLVGRRARPSTFLYGLGLLATYLLMGKPACLFAGMLVLACAGTSWVLNPN